MSRSIRRLGAPALMLLAIAGCTDPFERPGTWQPTGANDRNLRAMIADPDDLERGAAALRERGAAGSNAATRLLTEQRRSLPATTTQQVNQQTQQQDRPLPGLGIASRPAGGGAAAGGGGAATGGAAAGGASR